MLVTLIQATPDPIKTIAKIASICYDSDPKNPLGLVKLMVACVDPELQFMLVPKCKSGRIICNNPCVNREV